jgi:metal-sulfur cluster biosynthetic enzyme
MDTTNLTKSITKDDVMARLATVVDPELGIDIVSLGLILEVTVSEGPYVHILMTLTTPGCPLAGVFDQLVKDSLVGLPNLDIEQNVFVELTFDPPWVPDMMSEEARAELGLD